MSLWQRLTAAMAQTSRSYRFAALTSLIVIPIHPVILTALHALTGGDAFTVQAILARAISDTPGFALVYAAILFGGAWLLRRRGVSG